MRLVAQNALLFAARWAVPFKAEDTRQGASFTLADGSASTADLMTGTGSYTLVTGKGWRALRLPYSAGPESTATASGSDSSSSSNLVMDIILPDAIGSPADLPSATWGEATTALTAAETESQQQVALKLPKLNLASGVMNLFPVLSDLGVDLGSLDHIAPDFAVNQAVQQVRLIVDEEGTGAAPRRHPGRRRPEDGLLPLRQRRAAARPVCRRQHPAARLAAFGQHGASAKRHRPRYPGGRCPHRRSQPHLASAQAPARRWR